MYTNVHGSSKIVSFLFFAAELYKHNMKIYETWFVGSLVVSCLAFSDSWAIKPEKKQRNVEVSTISNAFGAKNSGENCEKITEFLIHSEI